MTASDWINLGNALATFCGVMVAVGIAVRGEFSARRIEDVRRIARLAEVFQRPVALTEIALSEMRRLFK